MDGSFSFFVLFVPFNRITPPIIKTIPENVRVLNKSPQTITPIILVNAVPNPDQIAYARLNGTNLRHIEKQ
jgi:hypothetical protein